MVRAPLWSYQLGLDNGWMPKDPRTAQGTCAKLGAGVATFDGTYSAWQTGGAGAGTFSAGATAQFVWPPTSIAGHVGNAALLPTYTSTGTVHTLPPLTLTAAGATVTGGNGWADAQDTASAVVTVAGCTYPDPWNAVDAAVPAACKGAAKRTAAPEPLITPPARL